MQKCTHPSGQPNVDEFVIHQYRFGEIEPMDALQWMGAVRMSHSNPHDSSSLINVLWSEKLHVCKEQIQDCAILTLIMLKQTILFDQNLSS